MASVKNIISDKTGIFRSNARGWVMLTSSFTNISIKTVRRIQLKLDSSCYPKLGWDALIPKVVISMVWTKVEMMIS